MATVNHRWGLDLHRFGSHSGKTADTPWYGEVAWIAAAAVIGFLTTSILANWLELERSWLVLGHATVVALVAFGYVRWSGIDLVALFRTQWRWGILAGIVAGTVLVIAVQREDGAARPEGVRLAWDLLWLGVVYGVADAVLLNLLPIVATFRAAARRGWTDTWRGRIGTAALAILASLAVTTAYHLGYPEFQGADIRNPAIGNSVASLAYVVSNNPLGALVSHIAMHVAAVLHGANGTTQLPPHY